MRRSSRIVCGIGASTMLCLFLIYAKGQEAQPKTALRLENDLVFSKVGETELKLDLAMPQEGDGPFPAVVCIHFGGWVRGERQQMRATLEALARHGFVAISPDYRLAPAHRFPAALEDCKAAVRWLRANAQRYRVEPARFGAFGVSTGGHLACLLGVTQKEDGLEGDGGNAEQSSAIQAVVSFFGPTDLTRPVWNKELRAKQLEPFLGGSADEKADLYRRASPIAYVNKNAPPFLFVHGSADTIVPIQQSEDMVAKLRQVGVSARLLRVEEEGHGLNRGSPSLRRCLADMLVFFEKTLKQ
jgi:acetyl esterase/lipase